ncbi:hypothetical protein HMI55_006258 [Coelomomyces lativittatus]|nr:hypothetical protein HMI55_006258 [Coelomomyces lativittatus]
MRLTFNFWLQSIFGLLVTLIGWSYLSWRTWQIYLVSPTNAIPYLFIFLELAIYISSVLWFIDMLWTTDQTRVPRVLPMDDFRKWPTVDIFIPCCNEPTDLVKDTVMAALWQDYPTEKFTIYVCDDGKDAALKTWVENEQTVNGTNVRYICRVKPSDQPHHAKAGNINHALTLTSSEFVSILDADMLIRPDFLRSMLAQFASNDIAFVQCPQYYYNVPDGDPLGQVCFFFYDVIMPHRDSRNSAPSVGTGVVFRRKALEQVGGIRYTTLFQCFLLFFIFPYSSVRVPVLFFEN